VKEDHLLQAIEEAIGKMHLLPLGFNEEETHHLFPVLKPFKEVKKPRLLLLLIVPRGGMQYQKLTGL
jgi:hypothetical protein